MDMKSLFIGSAAALAVVSTMPLMTRVVRRSELKKPIVGKITKEKANKEKKKAQKKARKITRNKR